MNTVLLEFEAFLARRPVEVCRVLGMSYSNYAAYRKNDSLPPYVSAHIETLKLLDATTLNTLVRERLRDH